MKFAVVGATGFIGQKLVSKLLKNHHSVTILGRSEEKARGLFGNATEFHLWEPSSSPASAQAALRGVDALINLAGEGIADRRWTVQRKNRIRESRILGTRNLVATLSLLGQEGPKSFVCASAIGFYGDRQDDILTEQSAKGVGFLSQVCDEWEQEAFKAPKTTRTVALRIGIVLGKEGGALKKLLPLFRMGVGGPVGNGRQWMSWIHVDDLVQLLIEAATNLAYQGKVNGVAPNPVTNSDFALTLGKVLGRPAFLPAPAFALKLLMGELSVLVLASQRVHPNSAQTAHFSFKFPNLREALYEIAKKKAMK